MSEDFTVLYFASASSYTGRDSDSFSAPVALSDLFSLLESKYPGIGVSVLESCLVTLNLDYVDVSDAGATTHMLKAGDEVAIIPPVSSG